MRASELPHITADLLDAPARAHAARALHHQCGRADLHRQRAARGRRHSVDDAVAPTRSARSWRAPTRCWSISAPSTRSGATRPRPRSKSRAEEGVPWVLDPVFIDRSEPRAAYARSLVAQKPRAIRLNRAEFVALSGTEPDGEALTRYALDTLAVHRADRHGRPGHRRRAARRDRERPSADGARDRDGLRGLGARTAHSSRSKAIAFVATAAALLCFGVAGEVAGEHAHRPGQFRDRDPRRAVWARPRHADAKRRGCTMTVDVRLNAIVDPERANGRSLVELARMVVAGRRDADPVARQARRDPAHDRARRAPSRRRSPAPACRWW